MFFRVLGPVELSSPSGTNVQISAEKQRRLLAALLLRANTWVGPGYLVEAVWPDKAPKSTDGNIKTYIHSLRGVIPPAGEHARIDSRRGAYRLRVERDECDATVFEDRVSAATGVLAQAQPTLAVEQLRSALGLWRGEPYEPLAGAEVEAEAERLRALLWHTRYTLAEALLVTGRADHAITLLWPLTAEDPLREKTWEHLLRALSADGRWAEVLVAFHKPRQVLADELGIAPGPELRLLHQLALNADEPRLEPHDDPRALANHADATDVANSADIVDAAVPSDGADTLDADQAPHQLARTHMLPRVSPWRRTKARSRRRKAGGYPKRNWSTLLVLIAVSVLAARVVLDDLTLPNHISMATDSGTPVLTFLSPSPGQVVEGVVTVSVRVSDPSQLRQVDFHQLTSRCPTGDYKRYIGPDPTPTADGVYEISFDTQQAPNGCLDFGAVGLDKDNTEILYPSQGTYVPVTVNNKIANLNFVSPLAR